MFVLDRRIRDAASGTFGGAVVFGPSLGLAPMRFGMAA
jgi:hypothetical protein